MKKILPLLGLFGTLTGALAFPTYDPFADATSSGGTAYAVGAALGGQTNAVGEVWFALNTGGTAANLIYITNGNALTYAGLPASSGNQIVMRNVIGPGARLNKGSFSPNVNGSILYYSFLVNVKDITALSTAAGGIFNVFINNDTGTSAANPTVGGTKFTLKKIGTNYVVGVNKNSTPVYDATLRNTNETLFIVGSYQVVTNPAVPSTADDLSKMWINPSPATFGASTPPAETIAGNTSDNDPAFGNTGTASLAIMNRIATAPNLMILDEVRFGTTWAYVTGGPEVTTPPIASTNVIYSSNFSLTVSARSGDNLPLSYRWRKNGTDLTDTGNVSGSGTNILTVTGASWADMATYSVIITNTTGKVTNTSVVTVFDPYVTVPPANQAVAPDSPASFTVSAIGTATLAYQWQRYGTNILTDGVKFLGATTASLTVNSAAADDVTTYTCWVTNGVGSNVVSSGATLTILDPGFTAPPQNTTVNYGSNAVFSAGAAGSGTLTYGWQKNGVDIDNGPSGSGSGSTYSGAHTTSLSINPAAYQDAGAYTLWVTNGSSLTASATAVLTVRDPYISTQPVGSTNVVGTAASFSVVADGSPSVTYAWQFNNNPVSNGGTISGAALATLNISAVSNVNGGTYKCIISSSGSGSNVVSSSVTLKVLSLSPGENLYWDGNGDTAGAGTAPQFTWGATNVWSSDSSGSVPTGAWLDGDTAVFSAGSDTAGDTYTVTVSGNQPAAGITFEEGNVTLSGGTLTMVGGGGQSEFNVADGLLDVINTTVVAGTNDFVKTGTGGLRLNGNPNTYTGRTILKAGTLTSANETRFGPVPGALVPDNLKFDGGTLEWVPTGSQPVSATRGVTLTANGGAVNVDNGGTITFNGPITGPGALTVLVGNGGTGNAFISNGTNDFTGGFTNASAGITTTFSGPSMYLPGPFTVTAGTVIMGNANNTIGPITVNGGQLRPNATPNALGSGVITVNGGLVRTTAAGSGSTVVSNNIVLNPSIADQFAAGGGNGTPSISTGGGGSQFGVEYAGVISGPGGILRNDTGDKDYILSGANTFSGGFTMVDYYINPANKLAFGTGTLTIGDTTWNGGTPTLSSGKIHDMRIDPLIALTGANAITNPLVIHYQFSLSVKITTNAMEFSGPIDLADAHEPSGIDDPANGLPNTPGFTPIYANSPVTHKFSGVIGSSAGRGLEIRGNGATLQLTAANTYPGGTIVADNPTLAVNNTSGSGTGPGFVLVKGPATLVGTGTIGGTVSNGFGGALSDKSGTISGGAAKAMVGKLTIQGGLDLSTGGTNAWELAALKDDGTGIAGADFDQVAVTGGTVNVGGATLVLSFIGTATAPDAANSFWQAAHTWTVVKLSGGASNPGAVNFAGIQNGTYAAGNFTTEVAGDGSLRLKFTAVPPLTIQSINGTASSATISWTSANGVNYQVLYNTNLATTNWLVLTNVTGTGGLMSILDVHGADPQRFYRLFVP